ncbi:aldo/keto reductase [Actinokineospora auranticolor]|uniref:Aryl-alcohol dehydrogenase-like predicted oxidoreductase n=1 Tax=Actinokineospora auranticolor TaxID=155976 RepID=A0A2S6H1A5_9PSEU|nr:aldo/keto reductase [Actinokineospora auranticolor]PPK71211.1 aryl-alcohol dehydrogenase-like predicted oxidoreductase [Actinokineospora auranticolor]
MRYRNLGASGLVVSEIGYGNWLTHDTEHAADCVRAAVDEGVTLFNTAAAWDRGAAEESLARGLKGAHRDSIVLSTGVYWPEDDGTTQGGLSRKSVFASLHGSLRRLGTDHIDLYHLLRYDYQTPLEETFVALSDLVRQGKVHYVATSEWTAEQIQQAAPLAEKHRVPLVGNQPQYSMLWRVPESQVIPACERLGIGQLAAVSLAQGVLAGRYADGNFPADSRVAAGGDLARALIWPLLHEELLTRVEPLRGVARHCGLTMAQLALAWVLQNPLVGTVVVGATRPEQVRENAGASGVTLDLDTLGQIDQLLGTFVQTDPRLTFTPPQYRDIDPAAL